MDIQKERKLFENWWVEFNSGRQISCDYVSEDNSYSVGYANAQWVAWQAAKAQVAPATKYFSFDGENYEIHSTLVEAKREAESAIEYFSECLADQQLDPSSDDNFHKVSYGIVLAESGYSVNDVVTQETIDSGQYNYDVGTLIMSLFLTENQSAPEDFVLLPVECTDEIAEAIAFSANVCGGIAGDVYASIIKVAQEQSP